MVDMRYIAMRHRSYRVKSFSVLLVLVFQCCQSFTFWTNKLSFKGTSVWLSLSSADVSDEASQESSPIASETQTESFSQRKSFWKSNEPRAKWEERKHLQDLKVGDELYGYVVQELIGKTGPKLYFECGVGRTDKKGNWYIVNGMMRLDRGKASVIKKRVARYRKKDRVPLFVSRVQKECGRFEVCDSPDDITKYSLQPPKISVTSLKPQQEVQGTITKLHPYGAIVDIGANRRGLLHIKKVAALYGRYIDKEKGLVDAGIEKGARVRLMVDSVEKRRVFLEFTADVKAEAEAELTRRNKAPAKSPELAKDELEAWADYASQQTLMSSQPNDRFEDDTDEEEYFDEEYDEYDEDSDIEEALGLDTY